MRADISDVDGKHALGSACWIDLGVADPEQAAAFYEDLFGWDVASPDDNGYRLISRSGHLVAALGPAEDPGAPYWTVYLRTEDAFATTAAVRAGGGTVVMSPTRIGDAGIAATLRDPDGATFALWQSVAHHGSWLSSEPGTLAGFELRVDDLSGSRQFWNTVVGWQFDDSGAIWCRTDLVGTWRSPRPREITGVASPWLIQLRTGDLTAALRRATRSGATIIDAEHGLLCDPAGAAFRLVARGL